MNSAENKNPVNNFGDSAFHLAARKGHVKICKMINARVLDKNPKDQLGWTPLHEAAFYGQPEIVKIILDTVEDKNPKGHFYLDLTFS